MHPTPNPPMQAMVLLRHDLPDGTSHFDWLIDRHPLGPDGLPPERSITECSMLTLRCPTRPDQGPPRLEAQLLRNHRRLYLSYEGEVGGQRGHVRRLARGAANLVLSRECIEITGGFSPADSPWGPALIPSHEHARRWRCVLDGGNAAITRS